MSMSVGERVKSAVRLTESARISGRCDANNQVRCRGCLDVAL